MKSVEEVDILIVGSGPSGTSTALHLVKRDPAWAKRIIVVDRAVHPRDKLCGGGITHMGQNILADLGLTVDVNKVPIRKASIHYHKLAFSFYGDPVFIIVRRAEFDHWLVRKVEERGVRVRQGERVQAVTDLSDRVEVETDKAIFRAKVLVAADGSRSTVRQKLKWDDDSRVARLLEILTPEDPRQTPEFQNKEAVFDFTPMDEDLQGYYWDFPSLVNGKPFMNRGVFDSRARPDRPKADLVNELRHALEERSRDLDDYQLKGHPIRWFDREGRFAVPRVLLVGDAAGADPLVGEGISFALAYGDAAAGAIVHAFEANDFAFSDYKERILSHPILKQLPLRTRLARLAYLLGKYRAISWIGWQIARLCIRFTSWNNPDYNPVKSIQESQSGLFPLEQR